MVTAHVKAAVNLTTQYHELDPDEREEILRDYVESCRMRVIAFSDQSAKAFAINNPETYRKNCRDSAIVAIRNGCDTWERIAEIATEHRKNRKTQYMS